MKSNSNARPVASSSGLRYTQKISLAAGSLSALYLLPTGAQAGITHVSGSPVSLPMSAPIHASVNWDVDGTNGADFQLFKSFVYSTIYFASRANGRGLVGVGGDNVQPLAQSFNVGPTLAAYQWNNAGQTTMNAMYGSGATFYVGYDFALQGFVAGDNYFGFRFLSGADVLYGWAIINFDLTARLLNLANFNQHLFMHESCQCRVRPTQQSLLDRCSKVA